MYLGDFAASDTIDFNFCTVDSTGAPAALSGGTVSVYKGSGATQSTAGVTLTASFDSVTGLNHVTITTASDGTFYADGGQFEAVLTAGTVGGVSVVGYVVGRFTLRAQAPLYPTTAGRKLDVSAGGEAGLDWANVGSQSTSVNLSATTINLVNTATTVTNQLTAAAIATGVWQDTTSGDFTVASSIGKSLYTTGNAPGAASGLALVGSNMGTVTSVSGAVTLSVNDSPVLATGTAQAGASNSVTLASGSTSATGFYEGATVKLTGGTGAGQVRTIVGYNGTTKVASVDRNWTTTPDNTTTYALLATDSPRLTSTLGVVVDDGLSVNVTEWAGSAVADPNVTGVPIVDVAYFNGTAGTFASGKPAVTLAAADVTGNVAADVQTIKAQTVTCAGGVTVPAATLASTTNITAGTITTVTNLTNAPTSGDFTTTMKTSLNAATPASTGSVTGDVSGKVLGGGGGTITGTGVRAVDGSGNAIAPASTALSTAQWTNTLATNLGTLASHDPGSTLASASDVTAVPGLVWDVTLASHLTPGSTGFALNAAGSAGDPWSTALPGAYAAGTAGHIVGTALPDIAPGSAGGLLRGGTNTATTFATLTSTGAFSINGVSNVAQTGDSYARIGATGSGLTSLAPASTALSTAVWTAPPTGFLAATFPAGTITNNTTTPDWYTAPGSVPTVSQIATAVWQDSTAGDFTAANSIGKSLYTTGAVPGAAGGLFIAGTNAATTITTALTTTFTGNLTGNVGGNVAGSVNSVTTGVTLATGAITDTAIAATGANRLADTNRRRLQANVEASAYGDALSVLSEYGFIQQAQESTTVTTPGLLTVYRTDGTTVLGTRTLTTDPAAEPITGVE